MQVSDLAEWVRGLDEPSIAPPVAALHQAIDSFGGIGLRYLSLDRPTTTLSGGEAQRVKTIRQLSSSLTDVTYVFDEPTTGLHPHDIQQMNELLLRLRDKGNTVLVVEHKPETIAIADHVVELGPGAGDAGGTVCFEGTVAGLRHSDTGKSVIVIAHHQAVMAHADWIIDLGPGAGHDGGHIVFEGTPRQLVTARPTLTGVHLARYVGI